MWTENDRKEARDAWETIASSCRVLEERARLLERDSDHSGNICYHSLAHQCADIADAAAVAAMGTHSPEETTP